MKLRNLGALALLLVASVFPAFATTTVTASETESSSLVVFPPSTDPVVELGDRHGCVFYPDDGNVNCFAIKRLYPPSAGTTDDYLEGDAIDFRANDYTNCVLKPDGTTYCWGLYGVGDPSADLTWGAEEVLAYGKAVALEVGYGEACILTESNSLFCNGRYTSGLNQPNMWNLVASGDLEFMVMGSYQVCYKKASENATLRCRGWSVSEPVWSIEGKNGAPGEPMPSGGGHYFLCVLVQDGAVDCMTNLYHETGNSLLPPADDTIDAVDVDGKEAFTCAVGSSGVLRCYGQLNGVNNKTFELATDAVSASVGGEDVCWITVSGEAKCWKSTPDAYHPPVTDGDGDGVNDADDAFPNDPQEWADSDGDRVGDNGDAFPNDPNESADTDGDGVGDNGDAFPDDPNESADSDGDGLGDNADPDDDGNNLPDLKESVLGMLDNIAASFADGTCSVDTSGKSSKSKKSSKSSKSSKSDKSSKGGEDDLAKAIKNVQESLTPKYWTDATHPDSKHGGKIFDEEKQAVKELHDLIEETEGCDDALQAAIDALVTVDLMLVDVAISEVSCSDKKCERDLAKAQEARAEALEHIGEVKEDKAIDDLKYAWEKVNKYASARGSLHMDAALAFSDAPIQLTTAELPDRFELTGNYPNPFNPQTTIAFSMPEAAAVRLTVYDLLGRRVALLVDGNLAAGRHEVRFDAANLPSGQYLYRLSTPKGDFTKLMMLLK